LRIGFHFPWRNTVTRQLAHIFCTVANRILDLKLILVGDLILAKVLQGFRAEPGYARIAQRSATRGGVPPALPLAQPCAR
jgi:hypothetical protein